MVSLNWRPIIGLCIFAFPSALTAQTIDPDCTVTDDKIGEPTACSPFLGCFESTETWFTGKAYGWNEGTLAATTSSGAICTGKWVSRNALGVGQAEFECDDGQSGTAFFTYQDNETGTATGQGLSADLGKVRVWSGNNIQAFLKSQNGAVDQRLMCGDAEIPIS